MCWKLEEHISSLFVLICSWSLLLLLAWLPSLFSPIFLSFIDFLKAIL